MNILYLSSTDPADRSYGAAQRSALLGEALRTLGEVYTLFPAAESRRLGARLGSYSAIPCWDLGRVFDGILRRIITPFLHNVFCLPRKLPISQVFRGVTFDCVVVRYTYPVARYRPWRIAPLYVDVDDLPLQVFDTSAAFRRTWAHAFVRAALGWRFARLMRHAAGAWVSNPEQTAMVRTRGRTLALRNLPLPPAPDYRHNGPRARALVTVGILSYAPNSAGVAWFLNTIWPSVHAAHPELEYWIVGGGLDEARRAAWSAIPNVRCLGFVKDLDAVYAQALAAVVPLQSGGGTCIKTLEALAHSRICLSTPFGARGCPPQWLEGSGLRLFDSLQHFLDALREDVLDETARTNLETQAGALAKRAFAFPAFRDTVAALLAPEEKA